MKPIPPPKKETRWEKFAKEKGIQNRKRSRMVWDEASQEWKPRWGFDRANGGVEDLPIVEIKDVGCLWGDPNVGWGNGGG
jgi:regulator of ribosome biosynthesis